MTKEEKAKAYDEVLEQAKKELNTCGSMDCDAARQIFRFFPQLRESEKPLTPFQQCLNLILRKVYFASIPNTEDINKFILDIVKNHTGELVELAKKHEYTDYQLRESEDKRIIEEIKFAIMQMPSEREDTKQRCLAWLEKQKEPHYTKRNALFDKCVENCDPEIMKRVSDEVDEMLEKEQKPAEWSDEDSRMLSDIAGYISGVGSSSGITKRERVDFLYELPKRFNLQPKQNWSEEDELMIKCCLRAIEHYKYTGKPNVFCPSQFDIDGYLTSPEKVQTWLKSLRPVSKESLQPHWKPSEEQMKMLAMFTNLRCASRHEANTLESLYNDLKKLM